MFENYLSKHLSVHAKRKHLREPHFLSYEHPENTYVELRKDIVLKAQSFENWGDNLPMRWICLENIIQKRRPEKVLSYTEAIHLAVGCSFSSFNQATTELDSFLKYEHEIGNVVFFEDLKGIIVLNIEWLVNVFRCVIHHSRKPEYIEWTEMHETEKILVALITKCLQTEQSLNLTKQKDIILQLMEKYDLIVRPINGKNDLYMPCGIKAVPFHNIITQFDIKSDQFKRTSWFYLEFNFLPTLYFNYILVSFVKSKKLIENRDRLCIFHNCGIFNLNESKGKMLLICLSKNAIAMQVWQLNCDEDVCYSDIKKNMIDHVLSMKQRYRIHITYEQKFKCHDGIYYRNAGRMGYDFTIAKTEYYCSEHKKKHRGRDIYKYWMTVC